MVFPGRGGERWGRGIPADLIGEFWKDYTGLQSLLHLVYTCLQSPTPGLQLPTSDGLHWFTPSQSSTLGFSV